MAARLAPAARTVYAAHSTFFVTTLDNLAAAHHANACEHVVGRRGVGDEGGVVATLENALEASTDSQDVACPPCSAGKSMRSQPRL